MNTKITKDDWHLVNVDPDPDFDPERNKRIIAETIRKNNLLRARKKREGDEKVRERSSAVAQYLDDLNRGRTESTVTDYFGRHEIARLRGEEILGVIRAKIGDVTKQKIQEQAKARAIKS